MQLCGSLSILWHCLSLGPKWKLTFSSPVSTAEFSKSVAIVEYFCISIYLALSLEVFSNEYELVFHFEGKGRRRKMGNYGLWRLRWFRKLGIKVNVKPDFICENIIYNCENSLQDKFRFYMVYDRRQFLYSSSEVWYNFLVPRIWRNWQIGIYHKWKE